MTSLSVGRCLDAWEKAAQAPDWERPLILLAALSPEAIPEDGAALSVGDRDAHLLRLRAQVFGPALKAVVNCPLCRARLELKLNVADLQGSKEGNPREELALHAGGYEVRFRLPNTRDLAAASECPDVPQARRLIFQRCVMSLHRQGAGAPAEEAPEEVIAAVARQMAEADPEADTQFAFTCPACGHQGSESFDIASYFWAELNFWAFRRLQEVHLLASAYGWREAEILQLSPARRQ